MRIRYVASAAGILGAALALWLLLPLPSSSDVQAAAGWGLGAGWLGFFLGFPLSVLGMPLAVAVHPYPVGDDTSGAWVVAAMIAAVVGLNWAVWGMCAAKLARALSRRRARVVLRRAGHPPNKA